MTNTENLRKRLDTIEKEIQEATNQGNTFLAEMLRKEANRVSKKIDESK